MKSTRRILTIVILLAMVIVSSMASAQTVRGRLYRHAPYGPPYPAGYVAVTLFAPHMGRSALAYSTPDGFYFLYNVPPGSYVLEIWAHQIPLTMPVTVYNQPWTDIPPFTIQ